MKIPLPSLRNRKSGSPYSRMLRLFEISNRPVRCGSSVETPLTEMTTGRPLIMLTRMFVLGRSLIVLGWKFATYKSRSPSPSISANAIDMLPADEARPDSRVTSTNPAAPSLRNNRVPLPSAFTSRSRSSSPSTSTNAAAVESCPSQARPFDPVTSSNVQSPKFRYSLFPLSSPQK